MRVERRVGVIVWRKSHLLGFNSRHRRTFALMPTPERRRSTWLTRRLPLALVASSFTWLLYTRFYLVQNPSLGPEIGFDARYAWLLAIGLTISLVSRTTSGRFVLKDSWKGHEFLEGWNWETFDDPTHGRVNYVTRDSALALNLTYSKSLPWVVAHKILNRRIISFRVILHHASFHLPGSLA
jgi:hypothetical protein